MRWMAAAQGQWEMGGLGIVSVLIPDFCSSTRQCHPKPYRLTLRSLQNCVSFSRAKTLPWSKAATTAGRSITGDTSGAGVMCGNMDYWPRSGCPPVQIDWRQ